jgi:8-amino-7-oxononanoate synthase
MTLAATVATIATEGEFIFSDELNHASIINGCRHSKARTVVYRHNDPDDLAAKLKTVPPDSGKLIVTDGVFSMEGDICRLPELKQLADDHGARLMVDDAHATGVLGRTGRGTAEHFDMEGKVDVVAGTFSKTFGAIGGFTGSARAATDFLRYNARESIFSASLPPAAVAAVSAALAILRRDPGLVERLRANTALIRNSLVRSGFDVHDHGTPILPIGIGEDDKAYRAAGRLEEEGVFANPVVYPAVPMGRAIIRISLMASHTEEQLARAADAFARVGRELEIIK